MMLEPILLTHNYSNRSFLQVPLCKSFHPQGGREASLSLCKNKVSNLSKVTQLLSSRAGI